MTDTGQSEITVAKPGDYLVDDAGRTTSWLASAYSREDIRDEWDYLFENGAKLREVWFSVRLALAEELADEDWVYEQFGDVEMNGVDTTQVYDHAKANVPGAHRYWTTEP